MNYKAALFKIFLSFSLGYAFEYSAFIDNLHLEFWNQELAAPNSSFRLFKYNRTQFALNVSLWILKDLDGHQIVSSTKVYVLMSNSFKFTGVELKVPSLCKMWKDDLYDIKTIMTSCGDVDLCNIKKGLWSLTNCWPNGNLKYFPKSIPQGSYKITMTSRLTDGTPLVLISWYGRANLFFKEMHNKQETPMHKMF